MDAFCLEYFYHPNAFIYQDVICPSKSSLITDIKLLFNKDHFLFISLPA